MKLELEEAERQVVIMALAHLAVERPGWEAWLHGIAKRIDIVDNDRDATFACFHAMRLDDARTKLSNMPELSYLFEDIVPLLHLFGTAWNMLSRPPDPKYGYSDSSWDAFMDRITEAEMTRR